MLPIPDMYAQQEEWRRLIAQEVQNGKTVRKKVDGGCK
jgi:hypothetical protein